MVAVAPALCLQTGLENPLALFPALPVLLVVVQVVAQLLLLGGQCGTA